MIDAQAIALLTEATKQQAITNLAAAIITASGRPHSIQQAMDTRPSLRDHPTNTPPPIWVAAHPAFAGRHTARQRGLALGAGPPPPHSVT
jgi:hypothetical protein